MCENNTTVTIKIEELHKIKQLRNHKTSKISVQIADCNCYYRCNYEVGYYNADDDVPLLRPSLSFDLRCLLPEMLGFLNIVQNGNDLSRDVSQLSHRHETVV